MIQTEDYKRELVSIAFAQKHVIFWVAFTIFVGAVLVANFWPPSYTAVGGVLVSGKQLTAPNPEALESPSITAREISKEDLTSELEILRSPEVVSAALSYVAVKHPEAVSGTGGPGPVEIFEISSKLETVIIPASNVIRVSLRDRKPDFSSDFVNALMEQYIVQRARFFRGVSPGVSPQRLGEQIEGYLEQLRTNEELRLALVESTGVAAPEQEIQNNIILKKKLEETLSTLEGDLIEKKATLANLERATEEDDIKYFAFIDSGVIRELSAKLADLLSERGTAARTYLPESTLISTMDEQIDATFAALRAEVMAFRHNTETEIAAVEEKLEKVRMAIAGYNELNVQLERQLVGTARIERESALVLTSLRSLSQRKEELQINESLDVDDGTSRYVKILSRAIMPVAPTFPRPEIVIPLGLLVGLLVGCTLGFLREYFDHSFKTPADVQSYLELPVLFSLAKPQNNVLSLAYVFIVAASLLLVLGFLMLQHVIRPYLL